MTTEKLPEWPEKPPTMTLTHSAAWGHYDSKRVEYYRARMEALAELVKELDSVALGARDYDVSLARELAALLAACERKEAGT